MNEGASPAWEPVTKADWEQIAAPMACRACAVALSRTYDLAYTRVVDLRDTFGYQMDEYVCPNCGRHILIEHRP